MKEAPAILVIDDSAVDRMVIERVLQDAGYVVYAAHEPAVALWILENRQVDLVVTDEAMPGQKGHELVAHIRGNRSRRNLPVVFVSGHEVSPKKVMEMFSSGGPTRFVPKPVSRDRLLTEITAAFADARDVA